MPPPVRRRLAACLTAALVLPMATVRSETVEPALRGSELTAANDARRRMEIAGRQSMLIEFMARAACLARLGVASPREAQDRVWSRLMIEQTLADLRAGSAVQDQLPETDARIVASLDRQLLAWRTLGPALDAGDLATVERERQLMAVAAAETARLVMAEIAPAAGVDAALVATLDVAGRQRTLVQRAARTYCYVAAGHDAVAQRAALAATVAELDATLASLAAGDPATGVMAPPVGGVADQIETVARGWADLRAPLSAAIAGTPPQKEDIARVAAASLDLLIQANAVVELYQAIADG